MNTPTLKKRVKNWLELQLMYRFGWESEDLKFQFCTRWMEKFGAVPRRPCVMKVSRQPRRGYTRFNLLRRPSGTWYWSTKISNEGNVFATLYIDSFLTLEFPKGKARVWVKIVPKP